MKPILLTIAICLFIMACNSESQTEPKNENSISLESNKKQTIKDTTNTTESFEINKVNDCERSELAVYVNDPDDSGTNIRNRPGGKIVLTLNGSENAFFLTVCESQNGWFKIKGNIEGLDEEYKIPKGEGWIHGTVISVDTRNYGKQELEILDSPIKGNTVATIKEESYGIRIKEICGSWVRIKYNGILGWIEADWLCGNPLTTCG